MDKSCDVVVIGGGPAGSTAASVLADKGWSVTLLEKARHPRFHVGESLLPMNLPLFEQLGVLDEVRRIGVYKPGAEFYDPRPGVAPHRFYFRDALDKGFPDAYQVRRADFDAMLLDNSARKGATVLQEHAVTAVTWDAQGMATVTVRPRDGDEQKWRARFVIDASGRDTFLAKREARKTKNPRYASAALFGHFENVPRNPGEDGGLISVAWFDHGWIWMIPLPDGITSVGAVCEPAYLKSRTTSPEEFLRATIARAQPEVRERLANARAVGAVGATGNYSYSTNRMVLPGAILIGDAWAFIDPVFSSGVLLGMSGAMDGAAYVDALLRGSADARRLRRRFEGNIRNMVGTFSWMIARFNSPGMRYLFTNPGNPLRVQEAVISMLAGDVNRRNGVQPRLLVFRLLYYVFTLAQPRAAWREWLVRRRRARTEFAGGTTEVDPA